MQIKKSLQFIWRYTRKTLKFIWRYTRKTLKFIWRYNELFLSFPIGAVLLYYGTVGLLSRGLQAYDMGVVQKLIIGVAFFFLVIGMTRIAHKLQWPELAKLNDEDENGKWEGINKLNRSWQSCVYWVGLGLMLSILIAGA
jgi:hypothetical protein